MADIERYNRGCALMDRGDWKKAIANFKGINAKEALLNLGNCYRSLGNSRLSIQSYRDALRAPFLDGSFGEYSLAENNIGLYYYSIGDDETAISHFLRAIDLDSMYGDAHWNLSGSLLRLACSRSRGMWDIGWEEYEWRFMKSTPTKIRTDCNLIRWQGEKGVSVCVLAEQGLGDALMWGRYLSSIVAYGCSVVVQCGPELEEVFKSAGFSTCFYPSKSGCTHAIPMCSLSKAFGVVPGDWLAGVFDSGVERGGVGVVWSGSSTHANDKNRSVNVTRFNRLAGVASLYSLNPSFKGSKWISPLESKSWLDTIKNILSLDLVITVDTSVAHMCGALGVECWVLMPLANTDFRWGNDSMGSSNIWYSTVRVYRNPGDWDAVFNSVANDLKDRYGTY